MRLICIGIDARPFTSTEDAGLIHVFMGWNQVPLEIGNSSKRCPQFHCMKNSVWFFATVKNFFQWTSVLWAYGTVPYNFLKNNFINFVCILWCDPLVPNHHSRKMIYQTKNVVLKKKQIKEIERLPKEKMATRSKAALESCKMDIIHRSRIRKLILHVSETNMVILFPGLD